MAKSCLVGEVDGVSLKGDSGQLVLSSSKSDKRDDERVMLMRPADVVSYDVAMEFVLVYLPDASLSLAVHCVFVSWPSSVLMCLTES